MRRQKFSSATLQLCAKWKSFKREQRATSISTGDFQKRLDSRIFEFLRRSPIAG